MNQIHCASHLLPGDLVIATPNKAWMVLSIVHFSHKVKITWVSLWGSSAKSPIFTNVYSDFELLSNLSVIRP